MKQIACKIGFILISAFVVLACIAPVGLTSVNESFVGVQPAYASIQVGGEEIQGYEPKDVVSTDQRYQLNADGAAVKLESTVIRIVKILMPLLMIACVGIIVYNAARNIFRKPEDRVPMGDLIKNMFVNFFFILFAWIIVEGIVFIVTNGETILFETLLG